ncbi:MAG: hypothetical protein M1836_006970 [Candelina mexicana]|nr:MAG: hypothetical protein M1836_006970 [Candelina mexicana]
MTHLLLSLAGLICNCDIDNGKIKGGDNDLENANVPSDDVNEEEEEENECRLGTASGQVNNQVDGNKPQPASQPEPIPQPQPEPAPQPQVPIAPAPPPPKPSPPPPPTPPSPNPHTEKLRCYDGGSVIGRGTAINLINDFCGPQYWGGTTIAKNHMMVVELGVVDAIVSVQGLNNPEFKIDGPNPDQDCGRILRKIIDKCDQSSTQYKQGGTVTNNCAIWRIDPGLIVTRFTEPAGGLEHDFG